MTASIIAQVRLPDTYIRWLPSTLFKCFAEARPAVLGIHLIRFAAGAAIAVRLTGHLRVAHAGTDGAAWELAIFAVYLFNGVSDVHEDRINGSGRPIATGALSRRAAAYVAACAALLSLAAAAITGVATAGAVAAVLVIGWQYSARPGLLKQRPAGTALAGAAMGFLAYLAGFSGQASATSLVIAPGALAFAITMSAWMAFVGAPAKDLSDITGDAAAGRRTLPVLWGERRTRYVIAGAAAAIAIAFAVTATRGPELLIAPAVALVVCTAIITLISFHPISTGSRSRRRLPYRIFMLTQYVTNICLLAAVLTH
jgi:4-hydroxybenzoate polyprenyltransferase